MINFDSTQLQKASTDVKMVDEYVKGFFPTDTATKKNEEGIK
jgi:hypothetical protein